MDIKVVEKLTVRKEKVRKEKVKRFWFSEKMREQFLSLYQLRVFHFEGWIIVCRGNHCPQEP